MQLYDHKYDDTTSMSICFNVRLTQLTSGIYFVGDNGGIIIILLLLPWPKLGFIFLYRLLLKSVEVNCPVIYVRV